MIQAEIHNRLNVIDLSEEASYPDLARKEDVLTSNVFGILKNFDVKILNKLLEVAKVPVKLSYNDFCLEFCPTLSMVLSFVSENEFEYDFDHIVLGL